MVGCGCEGFCTTLGGGGGWRGGKLTMMRKDGMCGCWELCGVGGR